MSAASTAEPKVMVLGLGNPDRGDDGVGGKVVRLLAGRLPATVELRERAGDLLAVIGDWAGIDRLVCIDAAASLGTPGRIHRLDAAIDALPREPSLASSHAYGLPDAIALARALGDAPAAIIVFAIEGGCFDAGAPMTESVVAAACEVANRIAVEVSGWLPPQPGAVGHA